MLVKKFILVEILEENFLTTAELNNHYNHMEVGDLGIKTEDKRVIVGSYDNKLYDSESVIELEMERLSNIDTNYGKMYTMLPIFVVEKK